MDILFDAFTLSETVAGRWSNSPPSGFGVPRIVTDTRDDCRGSLFIALRGECFDAHDFLPQAAAAGAAALLVEYGRVPPGIPATTPVLEVSDTLQAYQSLARVHRRRFPALRLAALTGSNGKTSTKEMLRSIFEEAFGADAVLATEGNTNNHVGVPQNLLRLCPTHKAAVIEMGTNHFGEIAVLTRTAEPTAALVVSIGAAHLEAFGDTDGVAREKSDIFLALPSSSPAVIPNGCPGFHILREKAAGLDISTFGSESGADVQCRDIKTSLEGSELTLHWKDGRSVRISLPMRGRHQCVNAAGAAALASAMGIPLDAIAGGLSKCRNVGFRARIREVAGVRWINDAYNANPDSTKAGLDWMADAMPADPSLLLVLGDMLELGPKSIEMHAVILSHALSRLPMAQIVAVGTVMAEAAKSLGRAADRICLVSTAAKAVETVREKLRPGMAVYLKGSRGMKLETVEQTLAKNNPGNAV